MGLPVRALAAPAPGSRLVRLSALAPSVVPGAVEVGQLDPSRPVAFDVTLAPSHRAELASLLRAQHDRHSPRYRQWLKPGEFARRFGPDPSRVSAVVAWLHGAGLTNVRAVNGHVEVRAEIAAASSALGVSFARYRAADGTEQVAPSDAPL